MPDAISNLQLDYLAEIYQATVVEMTDNPALITSADLAFRLGNSQSSVNRIMERLRDANLIEHERYVGMKLTDAGSDVAVRLIRKQNIIEAFLFNVMQIAWHLVHQEARNIRHGVNDRLLDRMFELSGKPRRSPYGEWITHGDTPPTDAILTNVPVKEDYKIARVLTRETDRLAYLSALGLLPDCPIHLLSKAPFDGPVQLKLKYEYRILGYDLAQKLTVESVV